MTEETPETTEQTEEEPPLPTDAPTGDTPDDDAPAGEGEDAKGYSIDRSQRPRGNTWTKAGTASDLPEAEEGKG